MASLQRPVVCPVIRAKQTRVYSVPISSPLTEAKVIGTGFWGLIGIGNGKTNVNYPQSLRKCTTIRCTFSSSSNGNGSMADNSNENESDYVNSSVVDAVEMPSVLLMAALRNVQIVKLVRVTERIHEAYFAELHLTDGTRNIEFEKVSVHSSSSDGLSPELDSSVEGQAHSTSLEEELDIGHHNVISLWYHRWITCI